MLDLERKQKLGTLDFMYYCTFSTVGDGLNVCRLLDTFGLNDTHVHDSTALPLGRVVTVGRT